MHWTNLRGNLHRESRLFVCGGAHDVNSCFLDYSLSPAAGPILAVCLAFFCILPQ